MKRLAILPVCLLASLASTRARADEIKTCQDLIPKESKLVFAREEPIEGGKRCYVRPTEGGEESYQGVVWDEPTAGDAEAHGCDVNVPFLLQLWEANLEARHAAAVAALDKKVAAGKAKPTDKPFDAPERTFAVAAMFDAQCRHQKNVQGAFESSGLHAEQAVMKQLVDSHALKPGYSLAWMIDQEPCRAPDKKPKEGYCTAALKTFAQAQKVASRVFLAVKVTSGKQEVGSAKTFATAAYKVRDADAKTKAKAWPTQTNFMELLEFRVKPASK